MRFLVKANITSGSHNTLKMSDFILNRDKAKAALLYIAEQVPEVGVHQLSKILYFAEQAHLVNYGRPITGDSFLKLSYGPVPSYVNDKINQKADVDHSVHRVGYSVIPNERPDMDELSESDVECLDDSILCNRNKAFSQLTDESHKMAWNSVQMKERISSIEIAKEGNAQQGIIDYIQSSIENQMATH